MEKENKKLQGKRRNFEEVKLERLMAFEKELLRTECPDWAGVLSEYCQYYLNSIQRNVESNKQKLLQVIDLIHDVEFNRRIGETVSAIKDMPSENRVPWNDVALSMLMRPHEVNFDGSPCPKCGKPMTSLMFASCSWAFVYGAGFAGPMDICPECRQRRFTSPALIS